EDPEFLDVNQIEDGAMILMARVQQDGFLRPKIRATVTLEDGSEGVYDWDENLLTMLPRPTRARRVEYEIDPGVLYHYEQLDFEGLTVLEEEVAAEYFVATGLDRKSTRLNSSHVKISYAVFCLKKKKKRY